VDYYEFACTGTPSMFVATSDPDPARIPAAGFQCCRRWGPARTFKLGDGSHVAALDAAIKERVAAEGYYIYFQRQASPVPDRIGSPKRLAAGRHPG
jgi:hypothetical protein